MITIYTKQSCPFCVITKSLLKENDFEFVEVNIDEDEEAQKFLAEQGHTTVPQLYKDGELFVEGGCQGFQAYLEKRDTENTIGELSI